MNSMCINCPRFNPEKAKQENKSWYAAHYCAGEQNEKYTGCVRRPWHPLQVTLELTYNVEKEQFESKYNREDMKK